MEKLIEVFNLGNLPTAPLDSFLELQEDFKKSDPDKLSKLQMLILTRGFKYSFKAWRDPDGKLWIIDAHQRRKALIALRKAGFTVPEIPYEPIQAADKKEAVEEIAAYNSEFAQKNPDTILFKKYKIDDDTLGRFNLGFEIKPLDYNSNESLFIPESESKDIKEDDLPETTEENIFAVPGDIFILGKNRLMCGDCRSMDDVLKLMDGHFADMILTDPPYNVDYHGDPRNQREGIENDSMDKDLFATFLLQVFGVMFKIIKPGGSFYVFHSEAEGENFRSTIRRSGFKISQCCIWEKSSLMIGHNDYQWQHEPCLYGWKPGNSHFWNSDRKQSTVWHFDKPLASKIHPTMKPIALMAYPICNSSREGNIVADFFSGSGSTIMACQQTDRIGYGMEIEPKYVSASVLRYKSMFPEQPITLIRNNSLLTVDETNNVIKCVQS
jgi:DNA modification methylase